MQTSPCLCLFAFRMALFDHFETIYIRNRCNCCFSAISKLPVNSKRQSVWDTSFDRVTGFLKKDFAKNLYLTTRALMLRYHASRFVAANSDFTNSAILTLSMFQKYWISFPGKLLDFFFHFNKKKSFASGLI